MAVRFQPYDAEALMSWEVVEPVETDVLDTRSAVWQKAALLSVAAVVGFMCTTMLSTPATNTATYMPISIQSVRTVRPNLQVRYAEDDTKSTLDALDALTEPKKEEAPKATSGDGYIDEMEEPEVAQYSDAMKRKLRAEYLGVGGDVNQKMPNYALWISVVITILALATWASGGCY